MATRNPTVIDLLGDGSVMQFKYSGLLNGDDGAPIDSKNWGGHVDRSVHVEGTPGAGGTIVFEGSNNDGAQYQTLRDPGSVALSFTAVGMKQVLEVSQLQRPRVTAGDGTTSLTFSVIARRQNPMRA